MMNKRGVSDENLIRREFYNAGDCAVDLVMMEDKIAYIRESGITPGFRHVVLEPRKFVTLNHGYYIAHTKDGRPYNLVQNFGDMIGRGNTKPSNPFAEPKVR